jgi:protein SCO1/2
MPLLLVVVCRVVVAQEVADPHAQHRAMMAAMAATAPRVSSASYEEPPVSVVREDGKSSTLPRELDDGRPVVLNFIYTTCTTICPLSSHVLAELQAKLGDEASKVHIVSISIDPEQDTPARLRDYAARYHAGPGWNHYTGSVADSLAIQRAFDVYRGDKMAHFAVSFLRQAPGKPWTRVEGFATGDELLQQYRRLVAGG